MTPKAQWIHSIGLGIMATFFLGFTAKNETPPNAKPRLGAVVDFESDTDLELASPRDPAALAPTAEESQLRQKFYQLDASMKPTPPAALRASITLPELVKLYAQTAMNPVTSLTPENISHFDPTGEIGFCFGRAMTAQLLARTFALEPNSIQKLFIVGALSTKPLGPNDMPEWRFHVTTLVRGPDLAGDVPNWYAIDPLMFEKNGDIPLTMQQWIARVQRGWDSYHGQAPRAKLYLTHTSAVMPDISVLNVPESGSRVIELNFAPENYGLFPATKETLVQGYGLHIDYPVYILPKVVSAKLFLSTLYPYPQYAPFEFLGLKISVLSTLNGQTAAQNLAFNFNGYFAELFTSLRPDSPGAVHALQKNLAMRACAKPIGAAAMSSQRAFAVPTKRILPFRLSPLQAPPKRGR